MKTIYQEYLEIVNEIKDVKKKTEEYLAPLNTRRTELIVEMHTANKEEYDSKESGTINVNRGEYMVKIKKVVDKKPTDLTAIQSIAPSCVLTKTTTSFSKKDYNKLPLDVKEKVDAFMENVEKEPTFEIKSLEE